MRYLILIGSPMVVWMVISLYYSRGGRSFLMTFLWGALAIVTLPEVFVYASNLLTKIVLNNTLLKAVFSHSFAIPASTAIVMAISIVMTIVLLRSMKRTKNKKKEIETQTRVLGPSTSGTLIVL